MAKRQFSTFHLLQKSLVSMSLVELPTMNQIKGGAWTTERFIEVGKI